MGFLSSVLGTKNNYNSTAPVNKFNAVDPATGATIAQANTQAAGGGGPASGTIAQQSALSEQLAAAANGQGPNPALEQLKQTTQQNINSAAGSVASTRGINPALAARMAQDSAGTANQTAAGHAATMSAQQQIAARQQLGQNLKDTAGTQLGQQSTGIAALGTAGGQSLAAQGLNAGVASQNANLDMSSQQLNAGIAGQNAQTNAAITGGIMNAAGAAVGLGHAAGGEVTDIPGGPLHDYLDSVHGFADGGGVQAQEGAQAQGSGTKTSAAQSHIGDPLLRMQSLHNPSMYANGGSIHQVPVQVSPQEIVIPPKDAKSPARAAARVAAGVGKVPGKAEVSGDSPKNDTVHATLPVGSVVIPRSIAQGANAPERAASFVASVLKRNGGYAGGGRIAPVPPGEMHKLLSSVGAPPAAHAVVAQDFSGGGEVMARTGRGLGLDETRRRIKRVAKPTPEAE